MDLWLVFFTGLTTGGLSCLAVQGGLLATAMTRQVEVQQGKKTVVGTQVAQDLTPVLVFLGAKLAAYTLLGFLLGLPGDAINLSPVVQGLMQIAAGIFMLGTALNMLNVHPIFRYFAIQPPKAVTRYIRSTSKNGDVFTPGLLGALTVLIPCGTTQAMMLAAISSGSGLAGAALLFAFVLGTSPTFLILGFIAAQGKGKLQPYFAGAAALLILVLGVVGIDSGLNAMGAPFAPSRLFAGFSGGGSTAQAQIVNGVQEFRVVADGRGYTPNVLQAQPGMPIRLVMVTENSYGCERAFTIPQYGFETILPATGETPIDIPTQNDTVVYFSCSMGMYTGMIRIGS